MRQPKPGYHNSTLNDKTQFNHIFYESKPLLPGWLTKPTPGKEEISQTSSGQNFQEPCARRCKSQHNKSKEFSIFQFEKISDKKRTKKLKERKKERKKE
jgi:hypothetical protein